MRKFAIAFLRNPSPSLHSHAFNVKGHPASFMFFNAFTAGEIRYEVADPEDGEVGASQHSALSDISLGVLETRKTARRPPKAPKADCLVRGTEGSLHAEISAVKAKKKAKASEKGRKKAIAKADLAGEKATDLTDIRVTNPERCSTEVGVVNAESEVLYEFENAERNVAAGTTEEIALHAKANAKMHPVQEDISKYAAKLEVNTYKCGRQWEETACKLLDYGIPYVHVVKMLQKCQNLSCTQNCADSTLQNFLTLGMSCEEIGCAISKWPTVLNITNSMFQSKVEFFESVGIGKRTLCKMICVAPMVITYSLIALRRYRVFWNNYMQDIHMNAICVMIVKDPKLLTYSLHNTVMPKIAYFEEQGYDKKILLKYSSILGMSLESFSSKSKLLEQFGMSDARKRSWGIAVLRGISNSSLHARFHNLVAAGFSPDQIRDIISKSPQVLCLSEDHINVKLSYAVNVMNLSLDALVACPTYWTHSFEKRIKYRYEVIKELQNLGALKKELSPGYMVCMTDADFSKRFVENLQDYVKHPDAPSV